MTNKSTMLLEHNLKQLKLPTFLREYDKLASQCASEGADHPDCLLRLSELELRGGLVCLNSAARFDKWNRAAVR